MRQSFWYKRAASNIRDSHSENKRLSTQPTKNLSQMVIPPDDSLKNQFKSVAHKMMEIAAQLEEIKGLTLIGSNPITSSQQAIGEMRCHLHNSAIILYCIHDHRLLCSTCVFGNEFHKRHHIIEAAKASDLLQTDLRDNEKVLKPKIAHLARERNNWQELLEKLEDSYSSSVKMLEREQDEINAAVSSAFKKNKEKLEEVFGNTRQSLKLLISSYSSIVKAMRFQHPHLRVKHHFTQEAMDRKAAFENLLPSVKLGSQMVQILDKFGKNLARSFKNQYI